MSDDQETNECLPLDDVALIRPLLDEFKSSKRGERKHVVRKGLTAVVAAREISHLRPLAQGKIIAQIKEQVRTWLHNHGRGRKRKDIIRYVRRWTVRQVVGVVHQKEVEQLCRTHSQALPGETAYLKSYQSVLKTYAESLPAEQQAEYQDMANEWSDRSPPQEVQQRAAEMHGPKYIKQFAKVMWKQCGMRLVVLEMHNDTKDELCIASHDFNRDMGGEAFADVRPGWQTESIMEEWAKYAQSQMSPDAPDAAALPTTQRKKKVAVEFELDHNDVPILNDPSEMIARDMEPVVRQFMALHYKKVSSGKKSAVDWSALTENQDDMVQPKYLPEDFIFRDPSKMEKIHYQSLLEHWYTRQEDDNIKTTFSFKGYWNPSTGSVLSVASKNRKQSKSSSGKRQAAPALTASKPTSSKVKVARTANGSQTRGGPPGIRQGDKGWKGISGDSGEDYEDSGDEDNDDEGEDEDDDGKRRVMPSRVPPKDLPFAANRKVQAGAPIVPMKNTGRLAAVADKSGPKAKDLSKKSRATAVANGSGRNRGHGLEADELETLVTKRPQPRPAYRGPQSDDATSAVQPIKEKLARKLRYTSRSSDLGQQFERPVTRNGGKRKVDDAGLQATGGSSSKKGKKSAGK